MITQSSLFKPGNYCLIFPVQLPLMPYSTFILQLNLKHQAL